MATKDYKIRVLWCLADISEDDYEQGELGQVHVWDMNRDFKDRVFDSIEDLIRAFRNWGFEDDIKNYGFFDGNGGEIITDMLTDEEGSPADKYDIEMWKKGEKKLYNAHLSCGVELIETRPMTDNDAKELGLDIF